MAKPSKLYLTVIRIIIQRTILTCLNLRQELTISDGRKDGRTDPNSRKASLFKNVNYQKNENRFLFWCAFLRFLFIIQNLESQDSKEKFF